MPAWLALFAGKKAFKYGLPLAIAAAAGAYHWWVVDGLTGDLAGARQALATSELARANQTAAYSNAMTDAAKRVNDAYQKALDKRVKQEKLRTEAAQRIARNKQREAEAARVNLDVLRRQWDAHGHVCPVPDRTPSLLDFAAQATGAGDSLHSDRVPEAPAADPATGQPDDAARRAAEAL